MQEEVTQKTIALYVKVGKGAARLTEQALQKAIQKFLEQKSKPAHGKQTMRQLMKQNAGVSNIEITDSNIKAFESTAKKYNIDFSLKKVKGEQTRYLIPNIIIRKTKPIGHYGRLRKAYLEMHRPILFNELVLSDKLFEHCAEIEEAARNRMELIVRSLAEQNGVTEQLKAENQMEWVRQMNACKAQAEEIVKVELIYD